MKLWLTLLSCGENDGTLDTSNGANTTVESRLRLVSLNNRPQIEIEVRSDFDNLSTFTDEDGLTTLLTKPDASFAFTAIEGDSLQHRYVGQAPSHSFQFDALFLDRGSWNSLLAAVELEEQIGYGHLWVSIVNNDFHPVPGATAELSASSDSPFVLLETNIPWSQNSIDDTGKETLFFPNISPQDVTVIVTTPTNQTCYQYANLAMKDATTTIYADTASILWFVCSD